MILLGIESTCDETSVGVVADGRKVLSNIVASSSAMHEKYGGIVPEVAAREQVRCIIPTISEAIYQATGISNFKFSISKIDAIAVAYGPGLIGSLLVGVETAKALAFAWNKPLVGVNHLVGHLYANWLAPTGITNNKYPIPNTQSPEFPAIGLVVSGGHTDLVYMESHGKIKFIGGTLDDAAGEVLDKVGRVLGLGYPGGPAIEREAQVFQDQMTNTKYQMTNAIPVPMAGKKGFDFSFSGLKTAVVNQVQWGKGEIDVARICYELQERIFQSLIKNTFLAVEKYGAKSVVVGGGVSANGKLREQMMEAGKQNRVEIFFPEKKYSTDNGAMIASAAFYNPNFKEITKLQADPSLHFV